MTNDDIINVILGIEKGEVNDPADHGGETKFGITIPAYSDFLKRAATVADIHSLTADNARDYYKWWMTRTRIAEISDDFLRWCVADAGVNHGPHNPILWLQHVVGTHADGVLGNETLEAVNKLPAPQACAKFVAARARFYGRDITNDPTQARFAAGWMDRLGGFIERLGNPST